jgi:lipopolysaccharide/colanic/teichoic acid biosynthesis glycosyltransferase
MNAMVGDTLPQAQKDGRRAWLGLKRGVDLFGSTMMLLAVSPLLLVAAAAIYLTDRGPVLYRQSRIGQRGTPFLLLKFRSMRINDVALTEIGQIRPEHPLVTPIGRWIRRFKIDELPQLINVLRGEMSLIGPRPTVAYQVEAYSPFQRRRLDMPPGLSGWAQINGGIEYTWPERILLDVWYVEHWTFWLDVSILLRTMGVVFFGERANPRALADATAFAGAEAFGGWRGDE